MRRWRPLTWVILAVNLLFVVWIVAGLLGVADECTGFSGTELDLCEAGTAIGAGIGVGIIVFLWVAADIILGVVWLVTRSRRRECPACGHYVKRGITSCPHCHYDFTGGMRIPPTAPGTEMRCANCGSHVPLDASFCGRCGQRVDSTRSSITGGFAEPASALRRENLQSSGGEAPRRPPAWLIAFLAIVGIVVVLAVIGSLTDDDDEPSAGASPVPSAVTSSGPTGLFAGRVDAQPEDQERKTGEDAVINGVSARVVRAAFEQSVSDFEENGYIVADVSLRNVGDETRPYNELDWQVQTPAGQVKDVGFTTAEGTIGSGDLVSGGMKDGKVVVEIGAEKGDFYLIWKPEPFDAARGIWKVTL